MKGRITSAVAVVMARTFGFQPVPRRGRARCRPSSPSWPSLLNDSVRTTGSYYSPLLITPLDVATKALGEEGSGSVEDDVVEEDPDAWTLRQITFLGLDKGSSVTDEEQQANAKLDARTLSEFLMEVGACSVSMTDSDAGTDNETAIFDEFSASPEDVDEKWAIVIPDLAAGRNLWRRCDVSAHFPSSFDVASIIDAVRWTFATPGNLRYKVDEVPDLDWVTHVQESWLPIVTNSKFVLRFPWHSDDAVMKACQEFEKEKMQALLTEQFSSGIKRDGAVVDLFDSEDEEGESYDGKGTDPNSSGREYTQIKLEGGIAFGTGEHPTTKLCLDWVRSRVEQKLNHESVETIRLVDYGAGSGVLGIAAASLVRDYNSRMRRTSGDSKAISTVGIEIDADAIHIASQNAENNGVEMPNYFPALAGLDAEALSVVMKALQRKRNEGLRVIPEELSSQSHDFCVANILAGPLIALAPTISQLVVSGGQIGLSGILSPQSEQVTAAYSVYFDDVKVEAEDDGWVLITGIRNSKNAP